MSIRIIILPLLAFIFLGCTSQPKFSEEEKKITMPFNNVTYFKGAFQKLNRLLILTNQPQYRFQVKTIENMTSAKQAMPSDSRGFIRTPLILYMNHLNLVAYEPIYNKFETKTTGFVYFPQMKKVMPQLVINGGVTQFDKGIISESNNFDIDGEFGSGSGNTNLRFANDRSDDLSQIALDLNVFKYQDRTYLTGVATQNKIEIHRKRKKNRFGMFLNGSGIGNSKYTTLQQSKDEALRILTEYSLIQLLGRLYEVPYWRCVVPNMEPDEYVINQNVKKFVNSKQPIQIKKIEQLIGFYGYKSKIDAKITKPELQALSIISKKYGFKTKKILSANFYRELYSSAPMFDENLKLAVVKDGKN
ncbi:hypothetical protein MNB_SV-13-528 [hydrothermal vent metagenome]|uniref:Uncharacterized protein n=1 Tax=hydrothermal vent metagenome TaxID=652676 RepID=A0A1W1CWT3_9ZZZZ